MARSLFDLAASAAAFPLALQKAQKAGVNKSSLYVTNVIRGEIRGVTGDMRLSGVGRKGAKVGARYDIKGSDANPRGYIRGTGAIALIELDTKPHDIYPKGYQFTIRGRRRGKNKALKFGGRFAAYSHTGGTTGKHPFAKGANKAGPRTPKIFQEEVRDAITKGWL